MWAGRASSPVAPDKGWASQREVSGNKDGRLEEPRIPTVEMARPQYPHRMLTSVGPPRPPLWPHFSHVHRARSGVANKGQRGRWVSRLSSVSYSCSGSTLIPHIYLRVARCCWPA